VVAGSSAAKAAVVSGKSAATMVAGFPAAVGESEEGMEVVEISPFPGCFKEGFCWAWTAV
jgi:hypothetical protein